MRFRTREVSPGGEDVQPGDYITAAVKCEGDKPSGEKQRVASVPKFAISVTADLKRVPSCITRDNIGN